MSDEHDPSPWAPAADGEPAGGPTPPAASVWSEWSPSAQLPEPPPLPVAPEPTVAPPEEPPETESVSVGPVAAESRRGSRWAIRSLALVVTSVLVGGGGYLAFNAGTSTGGADSPEEAFELMLDALASGDLIAAAEVVEPTERATLIAAGFDLVDELIRLEVLADDLDLAGLQGVAAEFEGFDVRAEFPRSGLAHLFIEQGALKGSIDGAEAPVGPLLSDRLPGDWPTFAGAYGLVFTPTSRPVVAVERDGRWYLSLWYSIAENARISADQPLPDAGRRPARIGADSPEGAVRDLVEEVLRLDVRRMIGMLDPEEASALYDYSPLFLDSATRIANERLEGLETSGWSWDLDSLDLSDAVIDGDLATVEVGGFSFAARGETGSLDVEVDSGVIQVVFDDVDFWGDSYTTELESDGVCLTGTRSDASGIRTGRLCADELVGAEVDPAFLASFTGLTGFSVVTHEVDGRWFISPIRSGADTYIGLLRSLSGGELDAMVDGFVALGESFATGSSARVWHELALLGIDTFPDLPAPEGDGTDSFRGGADFSPPSNIDLLDADLPGVVFAFDVDEVSAASEISLWAPAIAGLEVERGVSATLVRPLGELALTVLVTPDTEDALAAAATLLGQEGAAVVVENDSGDVIVEVAGAGESADLVLVAVSGVRVIIVVSLGASSGDVLEVALMHLE